MRAKLFWLVFLGAFYSGSLSMSFAQMASGSFRIGGSVHSAGGQPTGSTNFQLNGTLGQPSPLMDPLSPPYSNTYDLFPGFWYAVAALESTCPGDFDGDKDADGADLAEYIDDPGGLGLDVFAINFGKVSCP